MKYTLSLILGLFMSILCHAQIDTTKGTVDVITFWSLNDTVHYRIVDERIEINGTDTINTIQTDFVIRLIVTDMTDSTYSVVWEHYIVYDTIIENDTVENYRYMYDLNYTIDSLGTIIDVDNFDIQNKAFILNENIQKVKSIEQNTNLKYQSLMSQTDMSTNSMFRNINSFHYLHGYRYRLNNYVVLEKEFKIGEDAMNNSTDSIIYYHHDSTRFYYIQTNETIDVKKHLEIIKQYSRQKEKSLFEKLMGPAIEKYEIENSYSKINKSYIFFNDGWPYEIKYEFEFKNINYNLVHRVTTYLFE